VPRPRSDGSPARSAKKRALTEHFVRKARAEGAAINVWDVHERGLVLKVQPLPSTRRSFYFVYSLRGRKRWYHIGLVPLSDARRIAIKLKLAVAEGRDPVTERQTERGAGTFAELAQRYVEEYSRRKNKSWAQADALVKKHLLPRWARLPAKNITRAEVRAAVGRIEAPVLSNQVLATASALFSWAVRMEVVPFNPCKGVERNKMRSRERVLSDVELPLFWLEFDALGLRGLALKVLLLCGQRPGEVARMRREHVANNWWTLPGAPDPALGWPGTKNNSTHRVWLPDAVCGLMPENQDRSSPGFVFATSRGNPVGKLDDAMQDICKKLDVERCTPHDLRRTHGSTITRLGFGREAMNRIQNHREGGIADVYDRHEYAAENQRVMETAARHILDLIEGRRDSGTVVRAVFK
jgi:integrase